MQNQIMARAVVSTLLCSWGASAQPTKPVVQVEASHMGDTAHLEFKGLKNWRYEVHKKDPKTIVLTVPALDEASVVRLSGFSDPLLNEVKVNKLGTDNSYVITFHLAHADVESFDYQTDDPSRLIVDFYRKVEPDVKKQHAASPTPKPPAIKSLGKIQVAQRAEPSNALGYKKVPTLERHPAGGEVLSVEKVEPSRAEQQLQFGIFDGGDDNYDRFRIKDYEIREDAIISSRHNIYLPFPILKMPVSQLSKLMEQQPEYLINPKDNRENKEARLLLTLFDRKRYAVFLKTYDYFAKKYPESSYLEILKNLKAHVHLARWKETKNTGDYEDARALYSELVQKFPASPLRERNYLILGYMQMEHGNALNTLQTFEGFLKTYPESPEIPYVHKALAEAYLILRKYDEALNEYNALIKDFPKTPLAYEARYRLGDVHFSKSDYSAAIRAYEGAIKELPSQERVFPNANFNMAESRFWQKDFKQALNNYVQFVNLFPHHDFGGYALTRIGEVLGILGADQRRVMGAFLESYFRFPNHPGASVARIRMLSQQLKGMKPQELKRALDEILGSAEKLDLPGIKEFTTLMSAEGLAHRGEYKTAIKDLITYYQQNPTSANLGSFKSRILRNIASELKAELDKGNYLKALELYNQYAGNWLKNSGRIDVPYFVAGAYEGAGAFSEAKNIYQDALDHRLKVVGTEREKEMKVQEHLPSPDSLHLRLAATMVHDRDYMEAFQHLRTISKSQDLTPAETVEQVQLGALIAEQRNDHQKAREALTELAEKWKGDPALVAPVHLNLAKTFLKLGDYKQAVAHADKVILAAEPSGDIVSPVPDKLLIGAMTAKAEALMGENKSLAAVDTYQRLLDRFESKVPLAGTRYKIGEILFSRGDLKGAAQVWQPLAGTANDLLWKIGKEKLDHSQWQNEFTKYVNRIPAMANGSAKENKP